LLQLFHAIEPAGLATMIHDTLTKGTAISIPEKPASGGRLTFAKTFPGVKVGLSWMGDELRGMCRTLVIVLLPKDGGEAGYQVITSYPDPRHETVLRKSAVSGSIMSIKLCWNALSQPIALIFHTVNFSNFGNSKRNL